MISGYTYCGFRRDRYDNTRIWGAAVWVEDGWTKTYLFWGSPKSPMVKEYNSSWRIPKKQRLSYRIKDKRSSWSGFEEVPTELVREKFPELESQIGMYILAKKLKAK